MSIAKTYTILALISLALFTSCGNGEKRNDDKKSAVDKEDSVYPHELLKSFEDRPFFFYNVENLFDTINDPKTKDEDFLPESEKKWTGNRYQDKLEKLATVLTHPSENNPLFVGFAEIENRFVVLDLMKTGRLAKTKYRVVHYDAPDVRGIDVAFAYDNERFKVLYEEAIDLSIASEPDYKTRDILYVKGLLKDSLDIHVFVNHWSSRRGGAEASEYKRINAAKALLAKTDSIRNKNTDAKIIIMGDFNDYPNNNSIFETLGAGLASNATNFVNLMLPMHENGEGSYNYRGEWGMLDQFIVSPSLVAPEKGLHIKESKAYLVNDDKFMHIFDNGEKTPGKTYGGPQYYGGYSDHLAIYGYLKMIGE
ncbi:endonuclease/exonuclease/phosphatase family protein [Brumimicrobium mesophilum]|uniref:endonuclease/exonuclease/phosphatase family protein n=1 Tax=Brumimicrobium mesophilum TaxID=392717 RepID=UPI000D1411B3|nr:endonuclease [Brumimicrobium mesophilum]